MARRRKPNTTVLPPAVPETCTPEPVIPQEHWHIWVIAALTAIVVLTGYWGTLDYPMQFDDRVYLDGNPLVKDSRSFGYPARFTEFANEADRLGLDPDLSASFILRPVSYLSFHINYLFDGFRPRWYRAVNIMLHFANGMLVYALLRVLLNHAPHVAGRQSVNKFWIAGTASLLFTAHPLAVESVTYIVQRFTSLAAMFFLATLIFHLMAVTTTDLFRRRVWQTLAGGFCFTGMLTKECMFTAPVVAVMLEWLVLRNPVKLALRHAIVLLLMMPVIPVMVVAVTWAQHGGSLSIHDVFHLANVKDVENHQSHYLITQPTVLTHYLRLMIWPSGLCVDPEWVRYDSVVQWPVLKSVAILLSIAGVTAWWHRHSETDVRVRLMLAGVVWFFVTISVSSSVFPLPDLVAEHRAFLPSIGIFTAMACGLDWGLERLRMHRWQRPWPAWVLASALVMALTLSTMERNKVWSSGLRLWEDASQKAPGKFRVWGNLGAMYAAAGRLPEAITCYEKSLELFPQFLTAYQNLSKIHYHMGKPRLALETCIKASEVEARYGRSAEICYMAAVSHMALGDLVAGEKLLTTIVKNVPTHQESLVALARLYDHQKRHDLARIHLHRAAMLGPLTPKDRELLERWTTLAAQSDAP